MDLDRFRPIPRAQALARLGLDAGQPPFVLFAADPERPEKRYDRARALARAAGVELRTLGGIAPELVPCWVNAANAVLVPSEREGFGLAVLEALACDVPVLATPVGVHPQALRGVRGALCAPFELEDLAGGAGTPPARSGPAGRGARARRAVLGNTDGRARGQPGARRWRERGRAGSQPDGAPDGRGGSPPPGSWVAFVNGGGDVPHHCRPRAAASQTPEVDSPASASAGEQAVRPSPGGPDASPVRARRHPRQTAIAGEDAPSGPPGFSERGRMRRRARFLRKARELAYRDLGGLVFDLHRFGQRNDPLVLAKLETIGRIDGELRALEAALAERRAVTVLREAGIAACPRCAAIHGSDDRFCPNCGLAMDLRAERPIAGAAARTPPPATPAHPGGRTCSGPGPGEHADGRPRSRLRRRTAPAAPASVAASDSPPSPRARGPNVPDPRHPLRQAAPAPCNHCAPAPARSTAPPAGPAPAAGNGPARRRPWSGERGRAHRDHPSTRREP